MSKKPLVTIICLCYNQRQFLKPAIQSVLDQTYENIELIVVDDASTDGSQEVIEQLVITHPSIKYFPLSKNSGNCKAFNYALKHTKGEYIIDLAADDILKPTRVQEGLKGFHQRGSEYGINYTDAEIIDESGNHLSTFYSRKNYGYSPQIKEGYVYPDLLKRYFICPPTLMFRKEVFHDLGGYDESLAYEDFDFLLRASKRFHFFFTDEILVKRRVVKGSMSSLQYKKGSPQLWSTYKICLKAWDLNSNKQEEKALKKRIIYEGRKALQLGEFKLFFKYLQLLFNKKPRP